MKRLLVAALACAASFPGTAHAAALTQRFGTTCSFTGVILPGRNYIEEAVVTATAAAVDTAHVDGNPVTVDVSCDLLINGVPGETEYSVQVPGAAAVVHTTSFPLAPGDVLTVCTFRRSTNRYGSDWTKTCANADVTALPPACIPSCPPAQLVTVVPQPFFD